MSVLLGQPLIPELTLGIYAATKSYVLTLSQSLHSESPAPAANLRRRPHRPGKSWRGAFNMTHGATMGAHASNAARSDDLS